MSRRAAFAIAVPVILLPAALFALFAPPPAPPPADLSTHTVSRSSAAYARLIARHVRDGTIEGVRLKVVDYASIPEDPDYRLALEELAAARPESMERDERMAFWINAYNLLAIRLVADRYPVASILEIGSDDENGLHMVAGNAGGRDVSLNWIEDELRRELPEPRVHFALVAAAVSCPDVRVYDAEGLNAQLEEAARAFLANEQRGAHVTSGGVDVSRLLIGYHEEFESVGGVIAYLRSHAPPPVAARLEGLGPHDLGKLRYDWSLNDAARASLAVNGR